MENKENKLDEQLTVTDNLIEAENAEFTENRFLIGEYSFIIQCNSSVIGPICLVEMSPIMPRLEEVPMGKLCFGNLFLNLSIFAKQSFAVQIPVLTCD